MLNAPLLVIVLRRWVQMFNGSRLNLAVSHACIVTWLSQFSITHRVIQLDRGWMVLGW